MESYKMVTVLQQISKKAPQIKTTTSYKSATVMNTFIFLPLLK